MASALHIFLILLGLFATESLATQDPNATSTSEPMVPITWSGIVFPGQDPITLNGISLEDIDAQVHSLNPNMTIFSNDTYYLETPIDGSNTLCNIRERCDNSWIVSGANKLRSMVGGCRVPAGPRVCVRMTCSFAGAIHWCNDNKYGIVVPCHILGDVALHAVSECGQIDRRQRDVVSGQTFVVGNWNVIVGRDKC